MASSSSNPSSTSSSTTSTPSDDRRHRHPPVVLPAGALPEEDWPELGTRAAAPRTRAAAPPTNPARTYRNADLELRGRRCWNSEGVQSLLRNADFSQYFSVESARARETAADPTSTFAPVMWSAEEGSSSSACSEPFPSSSTVASYPTDTTPVSAATSSSTLVPSASGSAPALETSTAAHTSSAPGVEKISDLALEPDALTSASTSAPKIVDASTPSSAPGVTAIADPSATTSAPTTTIPSLRDNWVALHWGIVPRPVEQRQAALGGNGVPRPVEQRQAALGGNGVPPVQVLNPDPLCPWREQRSPARSWGAPLCWDCRERPAGVVARPCGHLGICVRCYIYADSDRFFCPCCGRTITTWLMWR